jgi:hypothetical protein
MTTPAATISACVVVADIDAAKTFRPAIADEMAARGVKP